MANDTGILVGLGLLAALGVGAAGAEFFKPGAIPRRVEAVETNIGQTLTERLPTVVMNADLPKGLTDVDRSYFNFGWDSTPLTDLRSGMQGQYRWDQLGQAVENLYDWHAPATPQGKAGLAALATVLGGLVAAGAGYRRREE